MKRFKIEIIPISFEFHLFTPKYDKGKWNNYYIFPVIENPLNLKRILFFD